MSECQQFPDTWEEFEQLYGFTDKEEVYTNGSRLMQSFRVKQWLDHIAETERKWIPVTEALPEEKNMVLVTTVDDDIKTSFLTDKNYWWNIGRGKVTAWMPLPKPWRGE